MTSLRVGLLINPIAGIGAALAWKGTDDIDKAWDYLDAGGYAPVWGVARRAIASIPAAMTIEWVLAEAYDLPVQGKILAPLGYRTDGTWTQSSVIRMRDESLDLLVFVGGDGTAVDVCRAEPDFPIIGIPAGVKIFSACFVHRPEDIGQLLSQWTGESDTVDIMDLDEEAYRLGMITTRLVGSTSVPRSTALQVGKDSFPEDDDHVYEMIAERIKDEKMLRGRIAVGPGSTMQKIMKHLGITKSLLGVDIIEDGVLIATDCTAKELERLQPTAIWVTPIGAQGHIFGRGNKQISASIINMVGKDGIVVFAGPAKMAATTILYIDTGNQEMDSQLRGYIKVITGYYEEVMRQLQ